jgi:hypothetical protein
MRRMVSRMSESKETGTIFRWTLDHRLCPHALDDDQDIREDESDDEWLQRIGYAWERNVGIPNCHQLRWFVSTKASSEHPFVAILRDGDISRVIFLPTFESLLRLQAMIAPMISQTLLELHLSKLEETVSKAFRLWHGHHESGACNECDLKVVEQHGKPTTETFTPPTKA